MEEKYRRREYFQIKKNTSKHFCRVLKCCLEYFVITQNLVPRVQKNWDDSIHWMLYLMPWVIQLLLKGHICFVYALFTAPQHIIYFLFFSASNPTCPCYPNGFDCVFPPPPDWWDPDCLFQWKLTYYYIYFVVYSNTIEKYERHGEHFFRIGKVKIRCNFCKFIGTFSIQKLETHPFFCPIFHIFQFFCQDLSWI